MFGFGKKDKEIAALKLELAELSEANEVDNQAKEDLIKQNSALQNEINEKSVQFAKAHNRIVELETLTKALTEHNAALDTQSKRLVGSVQRAQEEAAALKQRIESLQGELVAAKAVQFLRSKRNTAKKSKPKKKAKR